MRRTVRSCPIETAPQTLPEPAAASLPNETVPVGAGLEAELAELERLSLDGLRLRWRNHRGRLAPAHLSRGLLLRVMAYRLQAETFGDLDRKTIRMLERLARATAKRPSTSSSAPPPASSSFGRACRLRRLLRLRPASTAGQGSFWRAYQGVGSSGRRIGDPIGRAAILDPFADDRVAAIAQTCDRRARGVRQPAGRGRQIANGRPLASPQHGDDRGQLAALPRRGVIGFIGPPP